MFLRCSKKNGTACNSDSRAFRVYSTWKLPEVTSVSGKMSGQWTVSETLLTMSATAELDALYNCSSIQGKTTFANHESKRRNYT